MGKKKQTPKKPKPKTPAKMPTYTVTRYVPYRTIPGGKIREYLKARAEWPNNTSVGAWHISPSMCTDRVYKGKWFSDRALAVQFIKWFAWDGIEVFSETYELSSSGF